MTTLAAVLAAAPKVATHYSIDVQTEQEARDVFAALIATEEFDGYRHDIYYASNGNRQWWQGYATFKGGVSVTISTPHVPIQSPEFIGGRQ
jgi:hypothetical protein